MNDQIVKGLTVRILDEEESYRIASVKRSGNPLTNLLIEAFDKATKDFFANQKGPLENLLPYGISVGPFETEAQAKNARYNANQAAAYLGWGSPNEDEGEKNRTCPLKHNIKSEGDSWFLQSVRIRK